MPFKSEQQRRYMWANMPSVAQKWSKKYGSKPKPDYRKAAQKKLSK